MAEVCFKGYNNGALVHPLVQLDDLCTLLSAHFDPLHQVRLPSRRNLPPLPHAPPPVQSLYEGMAEAAPVLEVAVAPDVNPWGKDTTVSLTRLTWVLSTLCLCVRHLSPLCVLTFYPSLADSLQEQLHR
jgi:hypothetical protein